MKTGKGLFPWAVILAAALTLSACSPTGESSLPEEAPPSSSAPESEAPSSLPVQEPEEEYTYLLGIRTGPSGSSGVRLSSHLNPEEYEELLPRLESLTPGAEADLGDNTLTLWVYSNYSYPLAYHFPAGWEGETVPVFCQPAEGLEEACWYEADQEFLAQLDSLLPALPLGADSPAPAEDQDALWIRWADGQRSVERAVTDPEALSQVESQLSGTTPLFPPPDPLPEGTTVTITLRREGRSVVYGLQDLGEEGCLVSDFQTSSWEKSCSIADRQIYDYLLSLLGPRPAPEASAP